MDRSNMRSSYVNNGPRSLPHMSGSKRHNGNGHGNGHSSNGHSSNAHGHNGNHSGHNGARLSPPMPPSQMNNHNNNNNLNHHDDLINYIFESWNKVTRDLDRGNDDAKYYQDSMGPRQLSNFRPFNLEQWWARRLMQTIKCDKHRS